MTQRYALSLDVIYDARDDDEARRIADSITGTVAIAGNVAEVDDVCVFSFRRGKFIMEARA